MTFLALVRMLALTTLSSPPSAEITARQLAAGEVSGGPVAIRGVVASAQRDQFDSRFNWIILRTSEGNFCAVAMEVVCPLETLRTLLDAEVRLTGQVNRYARWRRFLGYQLSLARPDGIEILRPPPEAPFAAPELAKRKDLHRQVAHGSVRGLTTKQIFLMTSDGNFLPVQPAEDQPRPNIGDTVTVAGFAETDNDYFQMSEALVRIDGSARTDPTDEKTLSLEDILVRLEDEQFLNPDTNGALCRLRGVVSGHDESSRTAILDAGPLRFTVDLSGLDTEVDGGELLPNGATAEVLGLCHASFETDRSTIVFPRFRGLRLILRKPDDLRIIARPPWWTPLRLGILIGIMFVLLGLFAVWVVALRIISTRRAHALAREQLASARAELKVEERTRLAVELHDSLSQMLTGVALQVDAAIGTCPHETSAAGFLTTARRMLASCRQELRCCLWDLRSRTFEEADLTEAVERTISPHTGGITTRVRFDVSRAALSETSVHTVLRIVRELVVNAIRHGHATHITIDGARKGNVLVFSVSDNGTGFDPAALPGPAEGHFGLLGIRERLAAARGNLSCESTPGSGSRFTVNLPIA